MHVRVSVPACAWRCVCAHPRVCAPWCVRVCTRVPVRTAEGSLCRKGVGSQGRGSPWAVRGGWSRGRPEAPRSSTSVGTTSTCVPRGHCQQHGDGGEQGAGAWRRCAGRGVLGCGVAKGRGGSSRRKGRARPLSVRGVGHNVRIQRASQPLCALLQGCGDQHPSAGEAAGHRGESPRVSRRHLAAGPVSRPQGGDPPGPPGLGSAPLDQGQSWWLGGLINEVAP